MTRRDLVVAAVAAAALATAAGGFAGVDAPAVSITGGGGSGAGSSPPSDGAGWGASGEGLPFGVPLGVLGGPGLGGPSPLLAGVFVVAVLACGVLAVALTGDDDRAPPPGPDTGADDDGSGDDGWTGDQSVAPRYGDPPDNAVVEAWDRLAETAGADKAGTPGETARRAVEQGLPDDAVRALAREFRAVRYGRRSVDDRRAETAADAIDRIERDGPPTADGADDDGGGR